MPTDELRVVRLGLVEYRRALALQFALCEQRDVKGLYARARRNEIAAFTGISDSYEPPVAPDLVIDTSACRLADAVESLMLAFGTAPRAAGAPIGVHA